MSFFPISDPDDPIEPTWLRQHKLRKHVNFHGLRLSSDFIYALEQRVQIMVEKALNKAKRLGHKELRIIHLSRRGSYEL